VAAALIRRAYVRARPGQELAVGERLRNHTKYIRGFGQPLWSEIFDIDTSTFSRISDLSNNPGSG
jgi:hypothetical protein